MKSQLSTQLTHHMIPKMGTIISNNGLWNSKSSDDLVKYEQSNNFTIISECGHSLSPFREVIDGNNYITVSLGRGRLTLHEINALIFKRVDVNYEM